MTEVSTASVRLKTAGAFWPFSTRAAVLTAPCLLLLLLLLLSVLRGVAGWPDRNWDGWLLLGIGVLSLLPILLVLLGSIAGQGGSLEAFGVKIRWAEGVSTAGVTVPPRLGVTEGLPMRDSGTREILATLRDATTHDVAVVELEDGNAWWETRLLVLSAGATRLGRPTIIVFLATEGGVDKLFQGWASPADVVRGLVAARDDLRLAYERAAATAKQWELALPPAPGIAAALPWPDPAPGHPWVAFPPNGQRRNELASEQFLAEEVGQLEAPEPKGIGVARLHELFAPYLRTTSVDESAAAGMWMAAVLGTTDPYLAVTRKRRYVGLMPRAHAINDILSALTSPVAA